MTDLCREKERSRPSTISDNVMEIVESLEIENYVTNDELEIYDVNSLFYCLIIDFISYMYNYLSIKTIFLILVIVVYFNIWNNRNYKFPKQKHIEKSIIYVSFRFLWRQHSGSVFHSPGQAIVMVFIKALKLSRSLLCSLSKFPKNVFFSYSDSLLILHSYNGIYIT